MSVLKSKGNVIVSIQKLIAGLTKHFADHTFTFSGRQLKTADVVTKLQSYLGLLERAEAERSSWRVALQAVDDVKPETEALIVNIHDFVKATFGPASVEVADFGMMPRQPNRSVANKAAAIVKGAATRVARHTMGRRQREAIHGVAPAPAPAPAQPAAAPAPTTAAAPPMTPTDKAA